MLQPQEEYVQRMSTIQITKERNEEQNNNRTTTNMERHTEKSEGTKCETTSKEHARQTKKKISKYISCKRKTKEKTDPLLNRKKAIKSWH